MFEKAIIRRAGDREIDLGMVAETIFFYGKTQLLINRNVVHELTQITCGDLLELSSRDCLSLSYVKPMFGVLSSGAIRVHDFGAYEFGPGEKKRTATFEEEILEAFIRAYGKSRSTNSAAKRFTDRVKLFRHPGFNNKSNVVCDLAREDIADFRFVRASVAESIHKIAPTYPLPADFTFEVFNTGEGSAVGTNLDFEAITKVAMPPFNEGFAVAHLLGFIQEARADTFFAAHYMADLVTTDLSSDIIRLNTTTGCEVQKRHAKKSTSSLKSPPINFRQFGKL